MVWGKAWQKPEEELVEEEEREWRRHHLGNLFFITFLKMFFVPSNIQNEKLSILNNKGLGLSWIVSFCRTKNFINLSSIMKYNYKTPCGTLADIRYLLW